VSHPRPRSAGGRSGPTFPLRRGPLGPYDRLMDRFSLRGKVAIITGASKGIGRALALGFADAGASVVVSSRTFDACASVVAEIEAGGGAALAFASDVGDLTTHAPLIEATLARFGRLDVLVNNAGVLKPHFTLRVSPDELDHLVAVNLKGPLFLSIAAVPHLAADGGGSIVNIGALGASQPMEGIGAYCAVKAAMANWSNTMGREWAAQNVRVNVLVPGTIATDMILPVDAAKRETFIADMSKQNVFGRMGEPDDLVGAAIFLASDASKFMTSRSVFIDGGMLR
jgi:NAD(P)-dependent dehydrogenase (short-subunit alcohol dehydrogenase family)